MSAIYTESIVVRNKTTDERETGLNLWLLPEGGEVPGDLIGLTENAYMPGEYEFVPDVVNSNYTLYSGATQETAVPVQHGGVTIEVRVIREGIVKARDTDFAYE